MSKQISKSIKTLMENPLVMETLNLNSDITSTALEATYFWGYDLFNRKPAPAYNEYGLFQGTDLDLACFLYALAGRGAVINIPEYKTMRQKKTRTDQKLVSAENRHGRIMGVQANKDFFTFSINVMDENVIGADKVGDFRTFSLTDLDGTWYDGWNRLEFVPTLNENKFITESKLWSGGKIVFRNMIHPNRWTSFFGHHYIISKMIIERLTDESAFLNAQMKELKKKGIHFPESDDGPKSYDYGDPGQSKSVKVTSFQAKVYIPESKYVGQYPALKETQAALVEAYRLRKDYQRLIKTLRFMTRATEYAHSKASANFPAWVKGTKWEAGFKIPKGRVQWDRLKLFQDEVGEHSISLLRRWYEKSAKVDASY